MNTMATYYRDRAVTISEAHLRVGDKAYRLDDLELVWHRRGARGRRGTAIIAGRVGLVLLLLVGIAGVLLAVRSVDLSRYDTAMLLAGGAIGVALVATVGLWAVEGFISLVERSYAKGSSEYQIWARHHGADVVVFATRDRLTFGKVYRALGRAIEQNSP